MIRKLKGLGVKIAIDDFGTGYSSLSYLHRFPFDVIKIDRSFTSRMTSDRQCLGIVKTIIALAAELDKAVIAEGLETEEQAELLTGMGCDYGQGYMYSRPMSVHASSRYLAERKRYSDVSVIPGSKQANEYALP